MATKKTTEETCPSCGSNRLYKFSNEFHMRTRCLDCQKNWATGQNHPLREEQVITMTQYGPSAHTRTEQVLTHGDSKRLGHEDRDFRDPKKNYTREE